MPLNLSNIRDYNPRQFIVENKTNRAISVGDLKIIIPSGGTIDLLKLDSQTKKPIRTYDQIANSRDLELLSELDKIDIITESGRLSTTDDEIAQGEIASLNDGGSGGISGLTEGSVLFANSSGNIGEDNSNFFWDDSTNRLGIGTDSPAEVLSVDGNIIRASASVNAPLVLKPKGTGAIQTNEGGDARGSYAIDLQVVRSSSTEVASGDYSFLSGRYNTASGSGSEASGYYNTASGTYSHAEGSETTASGGHAHAEGRGTTASGNYGSHAEGYSTTASSNASHAEGYSTTASGTYSHAAGSTTIASGLNSHAIGYLTQARGMSSLASGRMTYALGASSFSSGYYTFAAGDNSIAWGPYTYAVGYASTALNSGRAFGTRSFTHGAGRAGANPERTFTISGTTVSISGDRTSEFSSGDSVRFFRLTGGASNTLFVASRNITSVPAFAAGFTTFAISSALSDRTGGTCVSETSAGANNSFSINQSTVVGDFSFSQGRESRSDGDFSISTGRYGFARLRAQHAHGNATSSTLGQKQYTRTILTTETNDGSATELTLDGAIPGSGNRFFIPSSTAIAFTIDIVARRDGGSENAFFTRRGMIENTGGTTSFVGTIDTIGADKGGVWSISVTADDTNDSLAITVTGAVGVTIDWVAIVHATEVINA